MNTVELTDEEVKYLYDLSSRVITIGGFLDQVDESAFQKLSAAAKRVGPRGQYDMSPFEITTRGFGKVYPLTSPAQT